MSSDGSLSAAEAKVSPPPPSPPPLDLLTPFKRDGSPWSLTALDSITSLPPASRQREIEKCANENLSNGYPLFFHYVEPTLELRRNALLNSKTTKKKFYKSVGKLWFDLPSSQKAFWNGEASRLRACVKQKLITHEDCVRCVGSPGSWDTYIEYAEQAVAEYLQIPLPTPMTTSPEKVDLQCFEKLSISASTTPASEKIPLAAVRTPLGSDELLLDTLPDRFTVEPRMLYGHFAKYDFDDIRKTPTRKRQMEKLRQLADLFDQTGRVLFYYYVYPRLWKRMRPLDVDQSIATAAQDMWRFAEGPIKEQWRAAELEAKKTLGDGKMSGLEWLRLDSLDEEVLKLHNLAEESVAAHVKEQDLHK